VHDHRDVFERQGSIEARGVLTEVDDRAGGRRRVTNTPYRFSAAEAGVRNPAAYRGEHNHEALVDWLGSSEADIEEWQRAGILLQDDDATRVLAAAPPATTPS
jgi:crotonobetainyl-CoA:carnitine CoA-transferase CaiB-like acyl-CoA transferase